MLNPCSGIFSELLDRLDHDEERLLAHLGRQRLYSIAILCVAKGARGRGLGARLAREGEVRAVRRGCDSAAVVVSSRHSTQIYQGLGYTLQAEVS